MGSSRSQNCIVTKLNLLLTYSVSVSTLGYGVFGSMCLIMHLREQSVKQLSSCELFSLAFFICTFPFLYFENKLDPCKLDTSDCLLFIRWIIPELFCSEALTCQLSTGNAHSLLIPGQWWRLVWSQWRQHCGPTSTVQQKIWRRLRKTWSLASSLTAGSSQEVSLRSSTTPPLLCFLSSPRCLSTLDRICLGKTSFVRTNFCCWGECQWMSHCMWNTKSSDVFLLR